MPDTERPALARPAVLVGVVIAAISLAVAAPFFAGDSATLMLLVIVVTAAAWYGGPRLGFATTAIGSALTLFLQHTDWQLPAAHFYLALALYAIAGALISRLYGRLQAAGARLDAQREDHAAELEQARRAQAIVGQRHEAIERALGMARIAYWECDPATGQVRRGGEPSPDAYGDGWTLPRVTTLGAALERVHPEDRDRIRDEARDAWRNGGPFTLQCRVQYPNGAVRWTEVRGTATADSAGRPGMAFGLLADIDERKTGETTLKAAEARFRSLLDHAPALLWGNDADGRVFVNRACVQFTGVDAERFQGAGIHVVLHPDDADDFIAQYDHARSQKLRFEAQVRIRRADGEYRWFKAAAVPHYDGETFMGYAGSSVDITDVRQYMSELARAEHTLREADRRKDQFLAVLSHELRNPLNPIRNAVAVLGAGAATERDVTWARNVIERQVQQLARLLDDLMDVSRITQNKLQLRLQPVDVREVMGMALETAKPALDAREHKVETLLPPTPLYVQGDAGRLAQVFVNLLNNAAKYTDKGGRIRIRAVERGGQVVVTVQDNGMGIAPEVLPHIFDMFTQGEQGPGRSRDGLGIGLGLARGLVAVHGGRLEAHSEGRGRGSEFIVTLPAASQAVASAAAAAQRPAPRAGDPAGLRILVADDVRDSAEGLSVLLRMGGNDVRIATDGAEALAPAADFQPEVAVLDIGMPKLSGYEVARQIRREAWGERAVLIALTGWGQQDDIRRALDVGFNYHMVKPVNIPQLQELLEQMAARKARGADAA